MLNTVCLCGRLVAAPELKYTKTGKEVCSFRIAFKRSFSQDDPARFFDVTAFGHTAKYLSQYGNKGDLVTVEGRLEVDEYVSNSGENRRKVYVVGDSVDVIRKSKASDGGDSRDDTRERVRASIEMLRPPSPPPVPSEAVSDETAQWEDNLPF